MTTSKATDWDQLWPGRFLKAGEFGGKPRTLTITAWYQEDLPKEKGKPDRREVILKFNETKRELVLNKTNIKCLAAMFGRDPNACVGKRVTWYPMPFRTPMDPTVTHAVRVKGSPDIPAEISFALKVGRQPAQQVVLEVTPDPRKKVES